MAIPKLFQPGSSVTAVTVPGVARAAITGTVKIVQTMEPSNGESAKHLVPSKDGTHNWVDEKSLQQG